MASIKQCDYFEQAQDDDDDDKEEEGEEEAAAEGENDENQEESVDTAQPTQVSVLCRELVHY